ncbi:Type III pantothenate kinase [Pseudobythopirellula maris]|uniref:Type III pantothenate kinase n=1 Tax=Pseudobythopirellula maris TaxID=2527991 RepID=A0A5C5ZLU5_9BACT|nr:type III pantothenate kinase [Pseudobythopirellula maris]TWT88422.1 Type III pantothenate kinase [Pseudobythopirellula maris]
MSGLIAIDVGNSRVKLGYFPAAGACDNAPEGAAAALLPIAAPRLPEPDSTLGLGSDESWDEPLAAWLDGLSIDTLRVAIGSVCGPAAERIVAALRDEAQRRSCEINVVGLTHENLPLVTRVEAPERVGVDRLLTAVAANRLRRPDAPAIVVDLGTAITVDLVSADGGFEGGAILPGVRMSARALNEQTEALPVSEMVELDGSPDAVGKETLSAIRAGLYWGAVGAIRELIARQRDRLTVTPQVFLTGGAAPSVARLIGGPDYVVRHAPHLALSGAAAAAESLASTPGGA